MENKDTSLFTVYSQRLAGYLMQQGFVLIKLVEGGVDNRNKFLFPNSDSIRKYISEWKSIKETRGKLLD